MALVPVTTPACMSCGEKSQVEVSAEAFDNWKNGMLIQDAFAHVAPNERELLMTGTHPACWDAMFAGFDEE